MALSTDIGGIQVEAPRTNSNQRVNTQVVGPGAGEEIAGMINTSRVNKFNEELDKAKTDVFATEGTDKEGRIAPVTGDPDADSLLENIYALEDGINQSSGSRRSALGLELRQVYDKFSNKYPKLRGTLASELTRFERMDPEIAALDLLSSTDAAGAALEAKDLDRIKDEAYNTLGMSPGVEKFGSIEFAREFARRNRNVQTKNVNDQILQAQESTQDLDINSYLKTYQDGMSGEASDTTETYNEFREDLATVQLALQDPTQPGATETITLFNNGRKQQLMAKIEADIFESQRRFKAIPIKYADNAKYASARQVMESHVAQLSGLLDGLERNNPTLIQAYETYATAQNIAFEAENRDLVGMARQVSVFKDVMELGSQTFDGTGAIVQHELGQIAVAAMSTLIGQDISLATGLPGTARTPQELRLSYSAQSQGVQDITGQGAQSQAERQQFLIEEQVVKNQPEYLRLAGEGVLAPERAASFMTAQGVRLVGINQSGPLDWTAQKTTLEAWADPAILDLAKISNEVNPAIAQVAAEELANIAVDYDVTRVNNYIDQLNTKAYGQLLGEKILASQFIKPNFSDIENGNVSFSYDKDLVNKAIVEDYPGQGVHVFKIAHNKMDVAVRELSAMVSKDLKWLAHVEALHNGTNEADYATQYDLSFSEMRLPREDGQSNPN